MKTKVCNVVKNSVWYDPRVTKQLIEYSKRNYDIICVGIFDGRYDQKEIDKLPCSVALVGDYKRKKGLFNQAIWEYRTNRDICKKILEINPTVIHANDLNALIPACKAARKLKCKVIYDSHEIFLENLWIARNKIVKTVYSYFEKKLMRRIDLLVCVSHAARDYLSKQYAIPNSIVITNSLRLETIHSADLCKKASSFEVLNHGQFYEGRGYDLMVEAAKIMSDGYPDITFVLRGFGIMEAGLKEYVKDNGLTNVVFDPPVKTYQLMPMAARSSVGLAITEPTCLNFELSISNKLFEYAAAGLPVIMSNIPEHVLLNDKYNFGIVLDENTPECIAGAVKELYCNPSLYDKLAKNALVFSETVCWDKEFEKLFLSGVFN